MSTMFVQYEPSRVLMAAPLLALLALIAAIGVAYLARRL